MVLTQFEFISLLQLIIYPLTIPKTSYLQSYLYLQLYKITTLVTSHKPKKFTIINSLDVKRFMKGKRTHMSNFPKGTTLNENNNHFLHIQPHLCLQLLFIKKYLLDIHNTCLSLILAIDKFNTYCVKIFGSLFIAHYSWY